MINENYNDNVYATIAALSSSSLSGGMNEDNNSDEKLLQDEGTDLSFEFKIEDLVVPSSGGGGGGGGGDHNIEEEELLVDNNVDNNDDVEVQMDDLTADLQHHLASSQHHHRHHEDDDNWDDYDDEESEEESDFFAETFEEGDLPEHLKDRYIYQSHMELARTTTSQDIERNQFRLHGISKPCDAENPERVDIALNELDKEIEKLKEGSGRVSRNYKIAESQCKEFSRSFRLMFLRSVSFDVKVAAINMMSFFDEKLKLWGKDKLGKKITIEDFGEDGLEVLKNGHSQLLTTRDDAGRPILFNNLNHLHYTDDGTSQMRNLWYLYMTAFEDEETQKNGMIFIQYKLGKTVGRRPSRKLLWNGTKISRSLPGHIAGFHACFNRQSLPFIHLLKIGVEYHTSQRVRIHDGSYEEINYTLNCFGIPSFALPVSPDGDVIRTHHLDWLEDRRMKEKQDEKRAPGSPATVQVIVPSRCDVLFGRGRRSQFHSGNLRLNMYLEDKLSEYELGNRARKSEVILSIMDLIKGTGGRFLRPMKKDGSSWEEVSEKDAKDKIVHDFRTVRKRLATGSNAQKRRAGCKQSDKPNKAISMSTTYM